MIYILAGDVAEATAAAAAMGAPLRSMRRDAVWVSDFTVLHGRTFRSTDVVVETPTWTHRMLTFQIEAIRDQLRVCELAGEAPEYVMLDEEMRPMRRVPDLHDRDALEAWLDSP